MTPPPGAMNSVDAHHAANAATDTTDALGTRGSVDAHHAADAFNGNSEVAQLAEANSVLPQANEILANGDLWHIHFHRNSGRRDLDHIPFQPELLRPGPPVLGVCDSSSAKISTSSDQTGDSGADTHRTTRTHTFQGYPDGEIQCDLCNLLLNSQKSFKRHKKCEGHKKNLRKMVQQYQTPRSLPLPPIPEDTPADDSHP